MHVVGKRFLCLAALLPMFIVAGAGQGAQRPLDDARFGQIFRSESAQVGQMNIHYVAGGSGDVVILLHGWPDGRGRRSVLRNSTDTSIARTAGHIWQVNVPL